MDAFSELNPPMNIEKFSWNQSARRVLFAVLIALPILYALQVMLTHWVAVPWWDEWLTPGQTLASYYQGTLRFADLWSQHNESRKLFPRLLYLALYVPGGWDVRYGMILTFLWVCVGSVGLYWILLQTVSRSVAGCGFILMNLLLFSPRQYENFLFSLEGENFTPAFALVFALLCTLRAKSFRTKALVNSALSLLSTYTCANGMLVWLLAFPIHWEGDIAGESSTQRRFWHICYSLAAVISISFYFLGYKHPLAAPPFALTLSQLPEVLHYFVIWIGNLFITGAPAVTGILILACFFLLTIRAIRHMANGRLRKASYPWLILGCYVLTSGLVTASGRVGFGVGVAFDVRYTAFTVFLYIAIIGLFCSVRETWTYARLVSSIGSALLLGAWAYTYHKEMPELEKSTSDRKHLELVAKWSLAIPKNPDLTILSPYSGTIDRIQVLSKHKALRPRLVDPMLVERLQRPSHSSSSVAGYLREVLFLPPDRIRADGWAQIPKRSVPADCVVLGYDNGAGEWIPFGVTETGLSRSDVPADLRYSRLSLSGFSRTFSTADLPPDPVTFEARAVDLENKDVFQLSGAFTIHRPKN